MGRKQQLLCENKIKWQSNNLYKKFPFSLQELNIAEPHQNGSSDLPTSENGTSCEQLASLPAVELVDSSGQQQQQQQPVVTNWDAGDSVNTVTDTSCDSGLCILPGTLDNTNTCKITRNMQGKVLATYSPWKKCFVACTILASVRVEVK